MARPPTRCPPSWPQRPATASAAWPPGRPARSVRRTSRLVSPSSAELHGRSHRARRRAASARAAGSATPTGPHRAPRASHTRRDGPGERTVTSWMHEAMPPSWDFRDGGITLCARCRHASSTRHHTHGTRRLPRLVLRPPLHEVLQLQPVEGAPLQHLQGRVRHLPTMRRTRAHGQVRGAHLRPEVAATSACHCRTACS